MKGFVVFTNLEGKHPERFSGGPEMVYKNHTVLCLWSCYYCPPGPDFWECAALSEAIRQVLIEEGHNFAGHKLRIRKSSLLRV